MATVKKKSTSKSTTKSKSKLLTTAKKTSTKVSKVAKISKASKPKVTKSVPTKVAPTKVVPIKSKPAEAVSIVSITKNNGTQESKNLYPASYTEITRIRRTIANNKGVTVITSTAGGEGCSLISRLVAQNIAENNRKTLLIDFNLKNHELSNQITKRLQAWKLTSNFSIKTLKPLIKEVKGIKNLSFMTAPNDAKSIKVLKDSNNLKKILASLASSYDNIIIDTNSIGAFNRNNIDPIILGSLANNVVLVAMAGETNSRQIAHAAEQLKNSGANISGVIINNYRSSSPRQQLLALEKIVSKFSKKLGKLMHRKIMSTTNLD